MNNQKCRCGAGRILLQCLKWLVLGALGLFAVTFAVYMLNLENKLIYRVIYPFLQGHYNSQKRDRRI